MNSANNVFNANWEYRFSRYQPPTARTEIRPIFTLTRRAGKIFDPDEAGLLDYLLNLVTKAVSSANHDDLTITDVAGLFPGYDSAIPVPAGSFAVVFELETRAALTTEELKPVIFEMRQALSAFFNPYEVDVSLAQVKYDRYVTTTEHGYFFNV